MATFGALENIFYNLEKLRVYNEKIIQSPTKWFNVAGENVRELPDEVSTDCYGSPSNANGVPVEESFPSNIQEASPEIPCTFNRDEIFINIDETVDLQNRWTDDEDYELALVSYHKHKNKCYKRKLWPSFIAKFRRSKDKKGVHNMYHGINVRKHDKQRIFPSSVSSVPAYDDSLGSAWELV